MPQLDFFATARDLVLAVRPYEVRRPLQYVVEKWSRVPMILRYPSIADIPGLGFQWTTEVIRCSRFAVLDRDREPFATEIPQADGSSYFAVDSAHIPGSVCFQPGGLTKEMCLLGGYLFTGHQDAAALSIFRGLTRRIRATFTGVSRWWVGPEAATLLDSGTRLITFAIREPEECDLHRGG